MALDELFSGVWLEDDEDDVEEDGGEGEVPTELGTSTSSAPTAVLRTAGAGGAAVDASAATGGASVLAQVVDLPDADDIPGAVENGAGTGVLCLGWTRLLPFHSAAVVKQSCRLKSGA